MLPPSLTPLLPFSLTPFLLPPMPSTESIARDIKLMHVVFGVSSVALLGATIWMLAADPNREWKSYQREMPDIDTKFIDWRLNAEETAQFQQEKQRLESEIAAAEAVVPEQSLLTEFAQEVQRDAQRLEVEEDAADVTKAYETLRNAGEGESEKR